MFPRKDACHVLLPLFLGLVGLGCANSAPNRTPARGQMDTPVLPRLTAEQKPMPPLRIAEGPSGQTDSKTIVPVSAQGPALQPAVPDPAVQLRQLHRLAAERYEGIDSYIVRLRRREQVGGKDKPEEVILFKFRKQPWSVHLKWLGPENVGREVLYVKGQYENKIHTLLAAGDMPFAPAGKRVSLAPDSVLVRNASRHSVTEAGVGSLIEHIGDILDANERGDKRLGTLTYLGPQKRLEYPAALEAIEHTIPPECEAQLPRGGRRMTFFDATTRLPVLVITHDAQGHEVEYYCYDRFQFPVKLDDDDFNPDKLWKGRKP